ncbi:hypothetical protein PR048_011045 [Dryococelus australis]|uniref:Uncharacterized protein n=1 Tax=Dryococelus australis TaxID=614101 RepID=A0ABQ9HKJ1_9NEOP|nr:hypothetical protein PR048_011045 [Dryococelus australis]
MLARSCMWWPRTNLEIETVLKQCAPCQICLYKQTSEVIWRIVIKGLENSLEQTLDVCMAHQKQLYTKVLVRKQARKWWSDAVEDGGSLPGDWICRRAITDQTVQKRSRVGGLHTSFAIPSVSSSGMHTPGPHRNTTHMPAPSATTNSYCTRGRNGYDKEPDLMTLCHSISLIIRNAHAWSPQEYDPYAPSFSHHQLLLYQRKKWI